MVNVKSLLILGKRLQIVGDEELIRKLSSRTKNDTESNEIDFCRRRPVDGAITTCDACVVTDESLLLSPPTGDRKSVV